MKVSKLTDGLRINNRDKGWAWIVLCSSFIMQMLIDGTVSGYGIIYIGMKNDSLFRQANYTESQLALPGAIQACLFIISCGLSGALVGFFGFQLVACLGGLLAGLSMVFASFFSNIVWVILFYGFLSGFGLGSVWICALVSVTYYFEKYRGIASGLAASGNGMGYVVVPLILNALTEQIGWRHAVVVYSLMVCLLLVLAGIMLRPIVIDSLEIEQIPATGDLESITNTEFSRPRCRNRTITFCEGRQLEPIMETALLYKINAKQLDNNSAEVSKVNLLQSSDTIMDTQPGCIFTSAAVTKNQASLFDQQKYNRAKKHLWGKNFDSNSSCDSLDPDQHKFEDWSSSDKISDKALSQRSGTLEYLSSNPEYLLSRKIELKPLRRPDSFFTSSIASLRMHDRRSSETFIDSESQLAVLNFMEKLASIQNLNSNFSNELAPPEGILSTSNQTVSAKNSISVDPNSNCPPQSRIATRNSSLDKKSKSSCGAQFVKIFDLTLFTNYNFLILCAIFFFCQLSYFVPFMYFFTFALHNGFTRSETMYLSVIIGVLHILGRIVGGFIANIPGISLLLTSAISYFLVTLCHFSLPHLPTTFLYLSIYCGSFGFLCAVSCPLQALMCVQLLGLERLTMSLGNSSLVKAVAAVTGPIIAGYIKDCTGSLDGVFYWCGGCYAVGGLLHFCLYFPCKSKNGKQYGS